MTTIEMVYLMRQCRVHCAAFIDAYDDGDAKRMQREVFSLDAIAHAYDDGRVDDEEVQS